MVSRNLSNKHIAYLINSTIKSTLLSEKDKNISVRASYALRSAIGILRGHYKCSRRHPMPEKMLTVINVLIEAHIRTNREIAPKFITTASRRQANAIIASFESWCVEYLDRAVLDTSAVKKNRHFKTAGGIRAGQVLDHCLSRGVYTMSAVEHRSNDDYSLLVIKVSHHARMITQSGIIKALEKARVIDFKRDEAPRLFMQLHKECMAEDRMLIITPEVTDLKMAEVLIPKKRSNAKESAFLHCRIPTETYAFNFPLVFPDFS